MKHSPANDTSAGIGRLMSGGSTWRRFRACPHQPSFAVDQTRHSDRCRVGPTRWMPRCFSESPRPGNSRGVVRAGFCKSITAAIRGLPAGRMPASHGAAPLADVADRQRRDGPPELVGLPPASRADPVGRLVSREQVVDCGDAAVCTTPYGEPLALEGRPRTVSQQVFETPKRVRYIAVY
jgi:hypothetical protein